MFDSQQLLRMLVSGSVCLAASKPKDQCITDELIPLPFCCIQRTGMLIQATVARYVLIFAIFPAKKSIKKMHLKEAANGTVFGGSVLPRSAPILLAWISNIYAP